MKKVMVRAKVGRAFLENIEQSAMGCRLKKGEAFLPPFFERPFFDPFFWEDKSCAK